jgi:NAD(P)-dependent dehydrogenase (short-subunit alcohol dehydrogenase family)
MSGLPAVEGADPALAPRRSRLKGFDGYGTAEDVAAAFAFLLSNDARYVSGSILVIDGAQHLV